MKEVGEALMVLASYEDLEPRQKKNAGFMDLVLSYAVKTACKYVLIVTF